jgi:hypothetical protein
MPFVSLLYVDMMIHVMVTSLYIQYNLVMWKHDLGIHFVCYYCKVYSCYCADHQLTVNINIPPPIKLNDIVTTEN